MKKCSKPMIQRLTLGEFLEKHRGRCISIPLFQRNYKWDHKTVQKFLEDIRRAKQSGKKAYMIGMMTLYVEKENGAVQVIDGQQRLITLALAARAFVCYDGRFPLLQFERDTDQKERESFLCREKESGGVDVKHMKAVLKLLREMPGAESGEGEALFSWMSGHVEMVCRYTEKEPLQEFLCLNEKKIPFGNADYDRAYLSRHFAEIQGEIRPENVIEKHKEIQNYLYKKETEDIFCLAAKRDRDGRYTDNRMDLLFAKEKGGMQSVYEAAEAMEEEERMETYRRRFTYLENCCRVFEALSGQLKLNVNSYHAVRALYTWVDPGFDFFQLIDWEPMDGTAFEKNLYQEFQRRESENVFMQSQLFEELQEQIDKKLGETAALKHYKEGGYQESVKQPSKDVLDFFEQKVREAEMLLAMGKNFGTSGETDER